MMRLLKGLVLGVVTAAIAGAVVGLVSGYIGVVASIGAIAAGFVGGVGMGAGLGGKEPDNKIAAYAIPVVVAAVAFLVMYAFVFAELIAKYAPVSLRENIGVIEAVLAMMIEPGLFIQIFKSTFDPRDVLIFIVTVFATFYGGAMQVSRTAQTQAPIDERSLPEWTRKKKEESK